MNKSMPSLSFCALAVVAWILAAAGCATTPKKASSRELRETTEAFSRRLRWGDFKGMAQFIVPEQRLAYVKGILERGDDETLKVIDYELEHVQYLPEGAAIVLARVSWHRLPSVTTQSEVVSIHFEDRDGVWLIGEVEDGPLPFARVPRPEGEKAAAGSQETFQKL